MNGTSQTRPLYWSIRREVWENRFLYIAPLAVSAFVLFATFASMLWTVSQKRMPVKPISMAPAPVMFTILLVGFFYTLDALYGERRDRSILFWKSLPVSDFTVVASKAAIPFVVLPLFSWLLSVTMQVVLLLLSSPVLLANGISPASLASEMYFFEGLLIMFYGIGVHVLWFAPIYGWFILVSAWARRAPFLWAVIPFLAIAAVERILFNSWMFMKMVQYRLAGAMLTAFGPSPDHDFQRLMQLTPARFFSAPGLWAGLLFSVAFLGAAIRLRRNREPI